MADLRELLREASPPASGQADLNDLRRRVQRRRRTRRAMAAALILAVVPLLGVGVAQLRPTVEFFDAPPEFGDDTEGDAADPESRQVSERDVVLEGVDDAGVPWTLVVWLTERQTVCIELAGGVACGSVPSDVDEQWSAVFGAASQQPDGPEGLRRCTSGALAPDVARVRLDFSDGTTVELEPASTALDIPARFYGHCWPVPAHLSATTALDAQGDALDHTEHDPLD